MPDIEWYNENANRHFPLVAPAETDLGGDWPKSGILDIGFMMGGESGFDEDTDVVWLYRAEYDGSDVTLTFLATPNEVTVEYTATFDGDPVVTVPGTVADIVADVDGHGYGFVVVGDVEEIIAAIDSGGSVLVTEKYEGGNSEVEPSRIVSQSGAVVTGVTVAHLESTRWVSPC